VDGENEEVGQGTEHEMVMKTRPGSAFKVVEAQIILGALEVLFDVPATATELQTEGFGGRAVLDWLGNSDTARPSLPASPPPARASPVHRPPYAGRVAANRAPSQTR